MDLDVPNQVVNEDVVVEAFFLRVDHVAPCDGNDVANPQMGSKLVVDNHDVDVDFSLHIVLLVVFGSSPLSIANSDPDLLRLSRVCRTVVGVVPAKLLSELCPQNLLSELCLQNLLLSNCLWLMLTC